MVLWKRFIDDILAVWTASKEEIEVEMQKLNTLHQTIKFTWTISEKEATFLDLELFKGRR